MSPQTQADLIQLQRGSQEAFATTLKSLIARGAANTAVADIVSDRRAEGMYVLTDDLAQLIAQSRSQTLYKKSETQLFSDDWALLKLYKAKFPDPALEKRLCQRLYDTAADDAEPRRRQIVEAMRTVASEDVLPTLEAILFDSAPTLQAKRVLNAAIEASRIYTVDSLLASLQTKSREEFLRSVAEAINSIRGRDSPSFVSASDCSRALANPSRIDNASMELARARLHLPSDPTLATFCVRRGAEALAKDMYRVTGLEIGAKPAKKMTLEELLKPIREKCDAPEVLKMCLETIQRFGDFASHDQDDQSDHLSAGVAASLVTLFTEAIHIQRTWLLSKAARVDS